MYQKDGLNPCHILSHPPSSPPSFYPPQSSHQLIHLCCWARASNMTLRCSSDGCPTTAMLWEEELPQRGRYLGRLVNRIGRNIAVIPSDIWHGFLKGDSRRQCRQKPGTNEHIALTDSVSREQRCCLSVNVESRLCLIHTSI